MVFKISWPSTAHKIHPSTNSDKYAAVERLECATESIQASRHGGRWELRQNEGRLNER